METWEAPQRWGHSSHGMDLDPQEVYTEGEETTQTQTLRNPNISKLGEEESKTD